MDNNIEGPPPCWIKNTDSTINSAIPVLGIYPKELKLESWKDTWTDMFTIALFIIDKIWKQPKHLKMAEGIKKMCFMHTMEYYSTLEKNLLQYVTT